MKSALRKALSVKHNPSWYGGTRCGTCKMAKVKEIDEDLREYARAKRRGHPMPWTAFVRGYIHVEYKTSIRPDTLRVHARKCLKIEV